MPYRISDGHHFVGVTPSKVMAEVAALRRLYLRAEEAWSPFAAKAEAMMAEARQLEELEARERARIERGQGSRDRARELRQEANAVWRRLHHKNGGFIFEPDYRDAEEAFRRAERELREYDVLLAEWIREESEEMAAKAAKDEAYAAWEASQPGKARYWGGDTQYYRAGSKYSD